MINIRDYKNSDSEAWEKFVNSKPEAKICHHLCYKDFIERVFGYKPVYWIFERSGKIVGVFPSFEHKNILGKKFWISQPFIEYGGILSDNLSWKEWLVFNSKVKYKLINDGIAALKMNGYACENNLIRKKKLYEYGYINLDTSQKLWENKLDRQARKAVNKAHRSGLICCEETTRESIEKKFYPLYIKSMKRLGSPPFSLKYFLIKHDTFKEKMKLFIVKDKNGETLSALMGYAFGGNVFIEFSVSREDRLAERPNDLVHWKFIEWACVNGYKFFDFGTIRYDSQKQFKKKWGVETSDYINSYVFSPKKVQESYYLESNCSKIKVFSKLWDIFMPEFLGKYIGPIMHKELVK